MQRSGVHPMKREEIIWQSIANLSCSTQPLGALPGYLTALCVTLHFLASVGNTDFASSICCSLFRIELLHLLGGESKLQFKCWEYEAYRIT